MIEIKWHGRLGNRMIQYSVASILAEKTKLKISNSIDEIFNNQNYYNDFLTHITVRKCPYNVEVLSPTIEVDDNFIRDCFNNNLDPAHYVIDGSGQICELLLNNTGFLREIFNFKSPVIKKEGVWVHARLGDVPVMGSGTLDYYRQALQSLNCKEGVIVTDGSSQQNTFIKTLQDEFNLKLFDGTPVETLVESRNYTKKVLSSGTYSWWMGVLVDNDSVYYYNVPENFKWHMPIFNRPGWIAI